MILHFILFLGMPTIATEANLTVNTNPIAASDQEHEDTAWLSAQRSSPRDQSLQTNKTWITTTQDSALSSMAGTPSYDSGSHNTTEMISDDRNIASSKYCRILCFILRSDTYIEWNERLIL